jgi:uncharacterized protein (TIGR02284 family)
MPGTLEDYAVAINEVISVCRDAEQGFRGAANAAKASALANTFIEYSERYGRFAAEIQEALKSMGFDPTYPQGVAGVLYAGWINVKAFVDGHDEHGIWIEVERIVARTMKVYREALDKNVPVGIRAILQKQFEEIEQIYTHTAGRSDANAESASSNRPRADS